MEYFGPKLDVMIVQDARRRVPAVRIPLALIKQIESWMSTYEEQVFTVNPRFLPRGMSEPRRAEKVERHRQLTEGIAWLDGMRRQAVQQIEDTGLFETELVRVSGETPPR